MMSLESKFPYFETEEYTLLGLPYKNQQMTMFIILPKERYGLEKIVRKMNATAFTQILEKKSVQKVFVKLPRFKIESSFQLVDSLKRLEIIDAFDYGANFAGITGESNLYISDVVHKAFIEVNEEGTVAAAATSIGMRFKMLTIPAQFIADHPFLFFIADKAQNIYFIGHHHG
uniref:Serpin domain-containing protein n=1 Tax=Panagrolaimus superbus TaxID=310955 RepID=A0A914YQL6_9BILA